MNFQFSIFNFQKRRRGFTLIELLVVIVIIGLLVSIGMIGYQSANRKARDSRRQSDLEQIRTGLELYRSDYGVYPDTSGLVSSGVLADLSTIGYISTLPNDPKGFDYYYSAGGGTDTTYTLCAHLELGNETDDFCGGASECGGNCNYQKTNP